MRPGFYEMAPEVYHADPCDTPSLSASIAKVLDQQSPRHAFHRHPKLGRGGQKFSDAFDLGTLSHALLLGAGKEIVLVEEKDWRKDVAKVARAEARASGKLAVLAHAYAEAQEVADTLRQRFADHGIELDGASELAAFWTERSDDGIDVQCRGMFDHLKLADATVLDLKSIANAHPDAIRRSIDSFGYAIQSAAYTRALERIKPETTGRADFVFVFYELAPPFEVVPVKLSGPYRELGERKWKRAVNTWGRCLRDDVWPGYADKEPATLDPMPWALTQELERNAAAGEAGLMGDM